MEVPFELSESGEITNTAILDRELQGIYEFEVFVKDNGSPSKTSSTQITVRVEDVNDNAPVFNEPHYWGFVVEDDTDRMESQLVKMVTKIVTPLNPYNSKYTL